MIRRLALASSLSLALLGAAAAPALAAGPPAALSSSQRALVDRATAYLQGLASVQGRFTQISGRGAVSTGTISMQRPGKARFEYDPPAQMLVVSDGDNVKILDRALKPTPTVYPLGRTPLVLLLARHVRLDRGVAITEVLETPASFSITAVDPRRQAQGRITITFSKDPVELRGWTVVDAQGQQTRVTLTGLKPVAKLDSSLFVLRDATPRSGRP
jgi:outer membrane lipoprotein-sorting protein